MRIAYVYDRLYPYSKGGVEKRVFDLSRQLTSRGHEVHRYGVKAWSGPTPNGTDAGTMIGIKGTMTDASWRSAGSRLLFAIRLATRLWNRSYDVVDIQSISPLACLSAAVVCRMKRTPTVITWHEAWHESWVDQYGLLGLLGQLVDWIVARIGTTHVAVSEHTAERLASVGVEPAAVLQNGVDTNLFARSRAIDERSGVVFLGRFVPHKNVIMVLDACHTVRGKGREDEFTFIGDGPLADLLLESTSLEANVRILQELDSDAEVAAILGASRLFALPSEREGFGLAALEAMAAKTPVVTVKHPNNALTSLVEDGVNGLVTELDQEAFTEAILGVLENDHLHRELAEGAARTGASHDWSYLISGFESFYASVSSISPVGRTRR